MKLVLTIGIVLSCWFSFGQEQDDFDSIIDSLRQVAEGDQHDTIRIQAYMDWDNLIYISDPPLDLSINKEILRITEKNLSRSSLSAPEAILFTTYKSIAHNNIGLVLMDYGDYIPSLDNLQKAYEIGEKLKDTSLMANATNNLGMIYNLKDDNVKSLEYYRRSMELDGDDDLSRCIYLNNIAMCYQSLGHMDTAMMYYRESLFLAERANHLIGMANTYGNIGEAYYSLQNYDSSVYYFQLGIDLYTSLNNVNGHVFLLYRTGLTKLKENKPNEAVQFCEKGLELLKTERSLRNYMSCHECLYEAFKKLNISDKALYHYELSEIYEDSMLSKDKNTELTQSQFRFEHEKERISDSLNYAKEQEINLLKINEQDAQLHAAWLQKLLLWGGLALLLVFSYFIYHRLKTTRKQKVEIELHKNLLEEKNIEILDSITYAKRIQEAILPPKNYIASIFNESFIYYQPKDIVAGDFYWIEKKNELLYFAAADCTGHGVPGAMVSVVCHSALNRSLREFNLDDPSDILNKARELIIETFEKSNEEVKDGMDIALCCVNPSEKILTFAGANNNALIVFNEESNELKGDKMPVGKHIDNKPFKSTQLNYQSNSWVYLFTDGYADQFGGEKGKKFKYKSLRQLLISSANKEVSDQVKLLDSNFMNWKGELEQVDDVCILGIRV